MSDTPAKRTRRTYTTEDVESALQLLCLRNGSPKQVEHETGIDCDTVRYWRDRKHADRYQQIRTEVFPKLHAKIAAMHEDIARAALEKQREGLDRLNLDDIRPADMPAALQKLSIVGGVATDKAWMGRDKPTVITENRSGTELLASIARRNPNLIVDSTAEEIGEADQIPQHTGHTQAKRAP